MKGDFFMKSFCIKTNNVKIVNYLLECLDTTTLDNIYFINRKFKLYNKNSKGSDGMVKDVSIKLAQNPTWGGVYLIIL